MEVIFGDPFRIVLERALAGGLAGVALVDRKGHVIGSAGAIAEDEAMPLAALVMFRMKSEDLAGRLFAGEVLSLALDERDVAVAIAQRQLFVVAVLAEPTPAALAAVEALRDEVASMLQHDAPDLPFRAWSSGGGGSGSGPADLALIEWGVTVPRTRGKA